MLKLRRWTSVIAFTALAAGLISGPGLRLSAQIPTGPTLSGPASRQANRVADDADLNVRAQVTGHIPTWATPAADSGAVANDAPQLLTFDLARSPEVQAAFNQLLIDQQNPTSPRYHQWLTPQQIGDQYGPTQHDLDAFTAWLASAGLTVSNITPSRIFVQATGSASVVSAALQISLHTFAVHGDKLQAPLTEPTFPASLAPVVSFVGGLATVQYHTFSTIMPPLPVSAVFADKAGTAATGTAAVKPEFTLNSGAVHYLAPADFNLIYDVTPMLAAGITGTGQRVAIIGGSRLLASDVTNWETLSALAAYQPNYIVPAGLADPGVTSDDNQGEATLDFERVYGTAAGAGVDLVISKNALSTDTDTLQLYAINTLNDPVMSMSYGACETGFAAYAQHENSLFSQAIAQGISVFASSGDAGVAGCEQQGAAPPSSQYASIQVPCDSAYVTCVGGTQFSDTASPSTYWSTTNGTGELSALSYIPEGAWNEPTGSGSTPFIVAATTGGPSIAIPKPTWQVGSTIPADSVRDVPDISFSASGHNAYFSCLLYMQADCSAATGNYITGFGGTSASAPSMAGLAAIIDQKFGKRQGLLNPILYATATSTPAAFHDATPATSGVSTCTTATPSTCNNSDAAPSSLTGGIAGYPLLAGYDFPTGLGSLDFGKFLTAISLPTPGIALTSNPAAATIFQNVQLTATLTAPSGSSATPTGSVQFYSNGVLVAAATPLTGGVATTAAMNFRPAATYSITATYSGDVNYSPVTSAAYSLVVTNPNAIPSSASLSVTPDPSTTLQSTTIIATVKGSGTAIPTGTVSFYDAGTLKGTPVILTAGVAMLPAGPLTAGTHIFTCLYSGDDTYAAAPCPAVTDVVTAPATNTVQTVSTTSGTTSLTYVVTSPVGGVPTGSITAYAAELSPTPSASAAIGSVSLVNGSASGALTGFTPGVYSFYGVYSGDITYSGSTSNTTTFTIAGFAMTSTPPSLSFSAGAGSGNAVTVTYTSVGGFTGAILQTCTLTPTSAVAVPIAPTCNPASTSVSLTGATATSTVTIGSSANAVQGGIQSISSLRTGTLGGISLAGLLLLVLPSRRRLLRNWRALSVIVFLTAALLGAAGCSGGGTAITGTTRGSYTMTITATTAGQTSSTTTSVTLN